MYFYFIFSTGHIKACLPCIMQQKWGEQRKNDIFLQSSWGFSAKKRQEEFCGCSEWSSGNGTRTHQKGITPTCFVIAFYWKPRLLASPCARSRDLEPCCWNQKVSFCQARIYLQSLSLIPDGCVQKDNSFADQWSLPPFQILFQKHRTLNINTYVKSGTTVPLLNALPYWK